METHAPASDADLLAAYQTRDDESAFAALVRRHESLVYAACMRRLQNSALAQDAAQMTFLLLAEKARALRAHPNLAGWLYQTANFQASNLLKKEITRARAAALIEKSETAQSSPEPHPEGQEHLDDALLSLRDPEREAVVLRFFAGRSLREVGDAQGMTEDAARKRISRALERMADFLRGRGAASASVTAISALLAIPAPAAPVGFSGMVLAGAHSAKLATAAGAHAAWWLKVKITTVTLITVAIPIVWQWTTNRNLRAENDRLRARHAVVAESVPMLVEDNPIPTVPLRAGSFRISSAPEPNRLLQLLDALLAAESSQRQAARLANWRTALTLTNAQTLAAETAMNEATQAQRDALHALSNGDVQFDRVMAFLRAESVAFQRFSRELTPEQISAFGPLQAREQSDLARDLAQWRLADLQFTLRLEDAQKPAVLNALAKSTRTAITDLSAPEVQDMPALLKRLDAIGAQEHAEISRMLNDEQRKRFEDHTLQRRKALDYLLKEVNP